MELGHAQNYEEQIDEEEDYNYNLSDGGAPANNSSKD